MVLFAFPVIYTGTRLGITAHVNRTDESNAHLKISLGPLKLVDGYVSMSGDNEIVVDPRIGNVLKSRGVTLTGVEASDDRIEVSTHVRWFGNVNVSLTRVDI